ncbi:DNA repair protein RecN [uncultured Clostridium sp.]|uniref:DNA repair protein RecN n=1 Tax=uncultured Clostridium sp. TaxID=59620 RepID=UPI0025E169F7|nr:DNA repair protein RecN [uncultured Clostridium sp.]
MLIQLNIKNFALIEEMTINFKDGFNILSGETGAGKSIMIDAIDFVLGGKFSRSLIRTGEDKTYVEALFTLDGSRVCEVLDELDIEYDDVLIISRESHQSGKNLIKINGKSLITSQLKRVRARLLDIHGQHQNQELLSRSSHILYLDGFIDKDIIKPLDKYSTLREKLIEVREDLKRITGNQDREKMLDYLKFQIEDIEKAKLKENEEETLREEYNILANAEKINSALVTSYKLLSGQEEFSVIDSLSKVISELSNVEKHFEKIKKNKDSIEEAFYTIEEASREIRDMAEEIVFDNDALESINSRIYEINQYKKKYGPTVKDILDYLEKIKKEYDEIVNSEKIIEELKEKEREILKQMEEAALVLHELRAAKSGALEEKILKELAFVGLEKSRMKISVEREDNFNERGFDDVCFLISTNPGEPLMPLEKVLSGGELSRIMLALKCVFAEKDEIPTLIFDEIDTGISGAVAQRVGEKMYQLSTTHQVLCITHLPQIAVLSDSHYFVTKNVVDNKTFTSIKVLKLEEKELEISKMLSGNDVTEATLNNVKEMIRLSEEKKKEIKN